MNWFAIHVKRFRETLAASSVAVLGLEVFLPLVKVECPEQEIIRVGAKPLFLGYLFARFSPEISLGLVESAQGVSYVIKSGVLPLPIDDEVIQEIQERVEADGLIRLQGGELKPGDRVCIQDGPFAGMMGRVEREPDDRRRVAILLEMLWQARVLIDKRWVQVETA